MHLSCPKCKGQAFVITTYDLIAKCASNYRCDGEVLLSEKSDNQKAGDNRSEILLLKKLHDDMIARSYQGTAKLVDKFAHENYNWCLKDDKAAI